MRLRIRTMESEYVLIKKHSEYEVQKNLITNGVVYPSLGAHLEHISHDYKFCRSKRDRIDHLTFIIVQQTVQLTPQGNGLQVLVQIQSLPQ